MWDLYHITVHYDNIILYNCDDIFNNIIIYHSNIKMRSPLSRVYQKLLDLSFYSQESGAYRVRWYRRWMVSRQRLPKRLVFERPTGWLLIAATFLLGLRGHSLVVPFLFVQWSLFLQETNNGSIGCQDATCIGSTMAIRSNLQKRRTLLRALHGRRVDASSSCSQRVFVTILREGECTPRG